MEPQANPVPLSDAELRRFVGREVRVAMIRHGYEGGDGEQRLARELGIGRQTLRDRLSGSVEFGTSQLYRIANILDVDLVDFYPTVPAA